MVEQNFSETLSGLKGYTIGIFLNGGQFVEGVLLDNAEDHIMVENNAKLFYYKKEQIRALTKNTKNFEATPTVEMPIDTSKTLNEILAELQYNWVTIATADGQVFSGFLSRTFEEYVVLINNADQLILHQSFISHMFPGVLEEENEEQAQDGGEAEAQAAEGANEGEGQQAGNQAQGGGSESGRNSESSSSDCRRNSESSSSDCRRNSESS
ncbi:MAG: hypothetical protein ACI35R_05220, partial [Bacillus sp. (in: firmicutes)]